MIAQAGETAPAAVTWETTPTGEFRPELFPLIVQTSARLMRNTHHGSLLAEAEVAHRGWTTLVVDVRVCDERAGPTGR